MARWLSLTSTPGARCCRNGPRPRGLAGGLNWTTRTCWIPDLPFHPEDWSSPLNSIEPDAMYGVEDF